MWIGSIALTVSHLAISHFAWSHRRAVVAGDSLAPRNEPLPIEVALNAPALCGKGLGHLSVSPDGKRVAYALTTPRAPRRPSAQTGTNVVFNGGCQVHVTELASGQTVVVPSSEGSTTYEPVWAPDGHELAVVSDRSGTAALWLWDRLTNQLRQLHTGIVRGRPVWTPDSRRLVVRTLPDTLTPERLAALGHGAEAASLAPETGQDTAVWVYTNRSRPDDARSQTASPGGAAWSNTELVAEITAIDVATGVLHRVAAAQPLTGFTLAPDGTRVAWATPTRFGGPASQREIGDVLMADLTGEPPRVLLHDVAFWSDPVTWSPDGSRLAYCVSNTGLREAGPRHAGDCAIIAVDRAADHGKWPIVWPTLTGANALIWSADGTQTYAVAHDTLWAVRPQDGTVTRVAVAPSGVDWAEDGLANDDSRLLGSPSGAHHQAIILGTERTTRNAGLYVVDLQSGHVRGTASPEYITASTLIPLATQDRTTGRTTGQVLYLREDAAHPADLYVATVSGAGAMAPKRVTHIAPELERYATGESQLISWRTPDSVARFGAVLLPPHAQPGERFPLIVYQYPILPLSEDVHRYGLADPSSFYPTDNLQLLATRGFAVLMPDEAARPGHFLADVGMQVLAGVERAIALGIADSARLGLMGHSHGGWSTLAILTQTTRFKAAVSRAGYSDDIGMYLSMGRDGSAFGLSVEERTEGGSLWANRESFLENSPVFRLERVTTPVLLIHGGADRAVAPHLADETFVALRRLDKTVEYRRYPGEDHTETVWSYVHQHDYVTHMLQWFETYVTPQHHGETPGSEGAVGTNGM